VNHPTLVGVSASEHRRGARPNEINPAFLNRFLFLLIFINHPAMKALLLSFCLICSVGLFAQDYNSEKGDPKIKKLLKKADIKYTLTTKGNYKVVFDLDNGRTQLVIINSRLYDLKGLEVREIWSTVYKLEEKSDIKCEELFELMADNATNKIGALQIDDIEGTDVLNFAARVPEDLDAKELVYLLELIASVADKWEVKFTDGKDDY
jgi:hypothetical protein